ncbi:MAG: DNA repair protein RecN [Bacteroidaceae bacterium]|nr:DNA repair protein RecN [Bacteroidaceae bacterium]
MIQHLHIENYALIEHLDIDLHAGFSVITGETGAGKSIILGAIGLLLGQRADSKSIKFGANRCVVEATFDLSRYHLADFFAAHELDFDGTECIVRREITSAGKSRAFINDTPVQLSLMKTLGEQLIDVHSQHKNLLLSQENFQLNVLDILVGNAELLQTYQEAYRQYNALVRQYDEAVEAVQRNRDNEDFLRFQHSQLAEAALTANEQTELEAEQTELEHAEEIKQSLYAASNALQSKADEIDALQLLKSGKQSMESILNVFSAGEELAQRLDACYIELKDIADEIDSKCESIEYNPERLNEVNERLNLIYTLEKKHHVDTIEELLSLQRDMEKKLNLADNSEAVLEQLAKQRDAQYAVASGHAQRLSKRRKEVAKTLETQMVEMLQPLGMPHVQFKVEINAAPDLLPTGLDNVTFLFTANKSALLQPIAKVASGGEIARVMLSLKALIAGAVKLPTIIFDEIDTGVSGSIAEKMARIMRTMGEQDRQVISITHLPQIAAMGTSHYKVYKEDNEDATLSHIVELTPDQRVEEIAHMLSGETLTEAALQNARSLLKVH